MALVPNPPSPPRYKQVVTITADVFESEPVVIKREIGYNNPSELPMAIHQLSAQFNVTGLIDVRGDSFTVIPIHMVKKLTITLDAILTASGII